MATYRPEQRGRVRQAKERATAEKADKPTPAQVLKEAMERR